MEVTSGSSISGGGGGGVPVVWDFWIALMFAAILIPARYVFESIIFMVMNGFLPPTDNDKLSRIANFSDSVWKTAYYGITQFWIFSIMEKEPWSNDTTKYFNGMPKQELSESMKLFYMCQGGFYVYKIVALAVETQKPYFYSMMSHHLITSILIVTAYLSSCFPIGAIILAFYDVTDIILKEVRYSIDSSGDDNKTIHRAITLSYLSIRVISFPLWIFKATSLDSMEMLKANSNHPLALYCIFNSILYLLYVFHLYWLHQLVAMLKNYESEEEVQINPQIPNV